MSEHRLVRYDRRHQPAMFGKRAKAQHSGRVTASPGKQGGGLKGTAYGCSCGGCLFGAPSYAKAVVRHREHVEQVRAEEAKQAAADAELREEAWLS